MTTTEHRDQFNPDPTNAKPGESDKDKALEIVSAWLQSRRTMMDGVQLGVAMDLVSFALSQNAAPVAAVPEIEEAAEIISNLITNIEKGGLYSKEAILTFLGQAMQCLRLAAPEVKS